MADKQRKLTYNRDHFKRIPLDIHKWEYEIWKSYADEKNIPLNTMIRNFVRDGIGNDHFKGDR